MMQKQKELTAAHGKGKKTKAGKGGTKKECADREATALPPPEKTTKQKAPVVAPPVVETQADVQRTKRTSRAEQNVETEEEYMQKLEVKVENPGEWKHWLVDDWDLVTRQKKEEEYMQKLEVKVENPGEWKHWLVDDRDLVTRQKKLVQLPARSTVDSIISDYVKQKLSVQGTTRNEETAIMETTNGIREYFNVMLGKQLLYKFERPQHIELLSANPDLSPSQIYGAIHLLRLFTRIERDLACIPLHEDSGNLFTNHLYDFVKYISKCSPALLSLSDYAPASAEYLRKAG